MGCVNQSLYQNKKFEHVSWYIERVDKRFGDIVVMHTEKSGAFICKKVPREAISGLNAKKESYDRAFKNIPEFLLQIKGFEESLDIINCESKRVGRDLEHVWAKIEIFDKDLNDDINLRALKNRRYINEEIWNLIYFSVFVFAMHEEASIEIAPIKRSNFVIANKKLKYYCEDLFKVDDVLCGSYSGTKINNNSFKSQFLVKKNEFVLMLLSTINLLHNINELSDSPSKNREELNSNLLGSAVDKIEEHTYIFVKERLIQGIGCYESFRELRAYLIEIYDDFEIKFFDRSYVNAYKLKDRN